MRDFDPVHRMIFAGVVLFLLAVIAVVHGRISLVMLEVGLIGLGAAGWVGGTGVQDFLKRRRARSEEAED